MLNNWQFLSSPFLPSQFWYQPCPSHSGSARSEADLTAAPQDSLSLGPGSACSTYCFLWLGVSHFAPAQESGGSRVTENTSPSPVLMAELWIRGLGTAISPTDPSTQRRLMSHSQRLLQCHCPAACPLPLSPGLLIGFFLMFIHHETRSHILQAGLGLTI